MTLDTAGRASIEYNNTKMKIENKIILSNIFNAALILLIGIFAYQNLNLVLTKLRFVEIADDLNASFLEMRLSEKNYFLYEDPTALRDIREKISGTLQSIDTVQDDIIRAIGVNDLNQLKTYLREYSDVVDEASTTHSRDALLEARLRAAGKKLREFSHDITHLERARVNNIILTSKNILFYSFAAFFLLAITGSHFISQKILASLRDIERLAVSISGGNFEKIEGTTSKDELGSVITAINSMSEELKTREEQLIQSKKLASLGVLTAGVTHELTNPVNNISMIAQTYAEVYDTLSRADRIGLMQKIEEETERIKDIIRNLLDFAKPKEANLSRADINAIIRKTLSLVQNMLNVSNIDAKLDLSDGLPAVFVDAHQIQQVIINLVVNAIQAMQPGGKLSINTHTGITADTVQIDVKDTGKGIPPEFLAHIFDPFFSTKGVGGTGLGLSVSYGIIKNHKGNITIESTEGIGTTFTIELPIYKAEEEGTNEQLQNYGNR
jgi:two-component system NtrC family sensor kinase